MDGHFKFVVARAKTSKAPIFTFEDTNMRIRFSIGARAFAGRWTQADSTHYMAACVGSYTDMIIKVAKIMGVSSEPGRDLDLCLVWCKQTALPCSDALAPHTAFG